MAGVYPERKRAHLELSTLAKHTYDLRGSSRSSGPAPPKLVHRRGIIFSHLVMCSACTDHTIGIPGT